MVDKKIETLVEVLRQTTKGTCAIALAGAHAKGVADASSDLDFYIFAEEAQPVSVRRTLIESIADPGTTSWVDETFDATPWGGGMDFIYQGTPVEVTARTFARMNRVVEGCLAGEFEIIPATWTSNGYYTFIYLCELSFIKPVWDPEGTLAALQQKAAVYPEKLRRSIVDTFWGRANTWLDNFHYESAIGRQDLLFTAPIVLHTILDLVQVIFALNRTYFFGDKKLEGALSKMPVCPAILLEELRFLLSAQENAEGFARQRAILRQIRDELAPQVREVIHDK